mmetsp:Transcript_3714/g.9520  ORF Transcript_3714/g.9520 Transcript_3714/m.9520 type:complete len:208 (-) Transcript_3714:1444-2067(-)
MEEGQDEVGALPQNVVGLAAVGAELDVVLALRTPHGLHHLAAELHGRGEGLRVAAHDEPKVNVEQAAVLAQHQVIQVAITDPQDVRDDAVSRTALDERIEHTRVQPKWAIRLGAVEREEAVDCPVVRKDARQHGGILDAFHQPVLAAGRQHLIERQLQVQVFLLEQAVHQRDYLHHQLVLPQIIAPLVYQHQPPRGIGAVGMWAGRV